MFLTILLLLVFLNGVLAMAEAAVVSARKSDLQRAADDGDTKAKWALKLATKPTRFLATMQIGTTFLCVLAGALMEGTIAPRVEAWMEPAFGQQAGPISLALVVIGVTMLILTFGEFIPKQIAMMYPESIASGLALPMRWVTRAAAPLVWILTFTSDAVTKIFGIKQRHDPGLTPEELKVLIKQGAAAGVIEKTEQDIFTNVLRMADRRASALMTPRTDIVWIDTNEPEDAVRTRMIESPHAYLPVAQGNLDHVLGVLAAKDCLARVLAGEAIEVDAMMRRPLIVPESISTLQLLESFRESPSEIALISDEFGAILGLVTQNDVLESIVGDLPSPEEQHEPEAVQREDGSLLVNGSMPVDEFRELFKLPKLPNENDYDTVGGFMLMQLQRLPHVADSFEWSGLRFEVMDLDGRRIDKVLVMRLDTGEKAG